jgi:ATP-dependent Clp protease adaptor protein ClpS
MSQTGDAPGERVQTQRRSRRSTRSCSSTTTTRRWNLVVHVLESIFQKSPAEAYQIMMHVHVNGRGIAGVYPWEVAETKAEAVISESRDAGFPLKAVTEEA